MRLQNVVMAACWLLVSVPGNTRNCPDTAAPGTPLTWKSAVLFESKKLNVDADGAPDSYLVDGNGLSYTCDGLVAVENGVRFTPDSHPEIWQQKCNAAWKKATQSRIYDGVDIFGFLTRSDGAPVVQGPGDPFPGRAYISTTSVTVPTAGAGTQAHYVDARKIPYIVLPSKFITRYKIAPGTLAIVLRRRTGEYAFAVYADGGKLGEASIKLHQDLGSKPIQTIRGIARAKVGIDDTVVTAVFPGNAVVPEADADAWIAKIKNAGKAQLHALGGVEALRACFP